VLGGTVPEMETARAVAFALPGLAIGSFLTVVAYRIPRRESIVAPRSSCPSCGTMIRSRDNIPVLAYVMLRGRCRVCGHRISPFYPVMELAAAGLFVGAALTLDRLFLAFTIALFLGLLLVLAAIDLRHRIIPNRIVYPSLGFFGALVLAGSLANQGLSLASAGLGFLAYGGGLLIVALVSPRGMGMGDVKLGALIGLVLGALGLRYVAVAAAAAILAGGLGSVMALAMGAGRKHAIPFGPYLAAGAGVAAFWAPQIAHAYLRSLS
jgi:leader peptidase (prepilin peptidase) / N-methyltransferase